MKIGPKIEPTSSFTCSFQNLLWISWFFYLSMALDLYLGQEPSLQRQAKAYWKVSIITPMKITSKSQMADSCDLIKFWGQMTQNWLINSWALLACALEEACQRTFVTILDCMCTINEVQSVVHKFKCQNNEPQIRWPHELNFTASIFAPIILLDMLVTFLIHASICQFCLLRTMKRVSLNCPSSGAQIFVPFF